MRREQKVGKDGERLARSVLDGLGLEMLERVGTPVKLIPAQALSRRNPQPAYHVIFGEKVAADWRAMLPDGTSVLIEVKTIYDRNLVWSDLRDHQPGKLSQHAALGGLSLLVWVHDSGVYVMRWPVFDFRPGKGITPDAAHAMSVWTVDYITRRIEEIRVEQMEGESAWKVEAG